MRSMRQYGLIHPILVRSKGDEKYEIVVGGLRYRAALALEWETIPAGVVEVDGREAYLLALAESAKRRGVPKAATPLAVIRISGGGRGAGSGWGRWP
ncbi:hypothetical protein TJA_23730 [Thermus sp. LT1-2-5]